VRGTKVSIFILLRGISKCVVALVTRAHVNAQGSRLKTAAALAEDSQVSELLESIWDSPEAPRALLDEVSRLVACDSSTKAVQESGLLINRIQSQALEESDTISDRKSQASLCLLYSSMVSKIRLPKHVH